MYFKFFLSVPTNELNSRKSFYLKLDKTKSTTHNNYKVLSENTITFNKVLYNLAGAMHHNVPYYDSYSNSRVVLIDLSDEAMFQISTLSLLPEYCYCTYNKETNKIGFGNTQYAAINATKSRSSIQARNATDKNRSTQFFDFFPKEEESEEYKFVVPEAFHEQVLQELSTYINFEKQQLFNKVSYVLQREVEFINLYFNEYFLEEKTERTNRTPLDMDEIKNAIDLYMNDDPVIHNNLTEHDRVFFGAMCLQIMKITNETF